MSSGSIDPDLVVNQDHLATPVPVGYSPSSAAGEYTSADLVATDRLLRSLGYRRDPARGLRRRRREDPSRLRMAVEQGDPWTSQVADQITAQLHAAGIAVVIVPVAGAPGLAALAAANSYDMALVTRVASPFQTVTAGWYSETREASVPTTSRTGASSTTPRWTSCSPRRHRRSIRSPGRQSTTRSTTSSGTRWSRCRSSRNRASGQRGPDRRHGVQPVGGRDPVERLAVEHPQAGPGQAGTVNPSWSPVVRPRRRRRVRQRPRRCPGPGWRRATMPVAPIAISVPLRRSGGIGRRASLRG